MNKTQKTVYTINLKTIIVFYVISLLIFLAFNRFSYSRIENNIDKSISNFTNSTFLLMSNQNNMLSNLSYNSNYNFSNTDFNNMLEAFNKTMEENYNLLFNKLDSIIKSDISNIGYWLSFLSLIMVIFTILGIYSNNKILESTKAKSEIITNEIDNKINEFKNNLDEYENNFKSFRIQELNLKALMQEKDNEISEAFDNYKKILEIDENNFKALNNLLVLLGNYYDNYSDTYYLKECLKYKDTILKSNLDSTEKDTLLINLSNLYSIAYKKTSNKDWFNKADNELESIFYKNIAYYVGKGNLYSEYYNNTKELEAFNIACKNYNNALSKETNNFPAINGLAILHSDKYYHLENEYDFHKSLEYFYKILSFKNDNLIIRYNIANLLKSYGDKNDKEEYINQAKLVYEYIRTKDPFNITSIIAIGCIYFDIYKKTNDNKYFYDAVKEYDLALSISMDDYSVLEYKAKIYNEKFNRENNIENYIILLDILNKIIDFNDKLEFIEMRAKLFFNIYKKTLNSIYLDKFTIDFNRAIELNSIDIDLKYYIGEFYLNKYLQTRDNKFYEFSNNNLSEYIEKTNKTNLYSIISRAVLYSMKYSITGSNNYFDLSIKDFDYAYKNIKPRDNDLSLMLFEHRGKLYLSKYSISEEKTYLNLFNKDFDMLPQNEAIIKLREYYINGAEDIINNRKNNHS